MTAPTIRNAVADDAADRVEAELAETREALAEVTPTATAWAYRSPLTPKPQPDHGPEWCHANGVKFTRLPACERRPSVKNAKGAA